MLTDTFGVEIWLRNRLAVPVNLDDLTVEFSPQDAVETVESEEKDVEIPALSTTKVSLVPSPVLSSEVDKCATGFIVGPGQSSRKADFAHSSI